MMSTSSLPVRFLEYVAIVSTTTLIWLRYPSWEGFHPVELRDGLDQTENTCRQRIRSRYADRAYDQNKNRRRLFYWMFQCKSEIFSKVICERRWCSAVSVSDGSVVQCPATSSCTSSSWWEWAGSDCGLEGLTSEFGGWGAAHLTTQWGLMSQRTSACS